ncbi:MAG: hypothetical protein DI630_06810 [Gordonia sp. (in: high G+C Gram-positive bacteria)]|nr:MAG: hypothetical protein DI630_06810 [Gordonia sp. (in: high G+C Gram-positive bacteria)]
MYTTVHVQFGSLVLMIAPTTAIDNTGRQARMKALVLTDRGDTEYVELPAGDPEQALREVVGGPLNPLPLTHLADHLDLWTLFEPLSTVTVGGIGYNDVASQIATAGVGTPRAVIGTAVLTAHTDSGILAALSPHDCAALDRIIAEIYTGYRTAG